MLVFRSLAACEQLSRAGYPTLAWINGGFDTAQKGDLAAVGDVDLRLGGIGGMSEVLGWTEVQRDVKRSQGFAGGSNTIIKLVCPHAQSPFPAIESLHQHGWGSKSEACSLPTSRKHQVPFLGCNTHLQQASDAKRPDPVLRINKSTLVKSQADADQQTAVFKGAHALNSALATVVQLHSISPDQVTICLWI